MCQVVAQLGRTPLLRWGKRLRGIGREDAVAFPAAHSSQADRPAGEVGPVLTERDVELLRHLADGRSTPQIAAAMSVTSNTTRTRIHRVQRKLGEPPRGQLVETARHFGVI